MTRRLLVLILPSLMLLAQEGQVAGVVTDSAGAVVPEAMVTAVHVATGFRRWSTSGATGSYVIAATRPGMYKITARKAGFQTVTRLGVKLDVGQVARVDFTLPVAQIEQAITVNAENSLTGTDTATISTVVGRDFIERLPLNGRSFQSLITLTPGVVLTKATFGEQGQFSVNGQRANANYFTIDGVSANIGVSAGLTLVQGASGSLPGLAATGGTNTLVSVEALEEFRIQTSGYAPEYGRMPGAQVTILTRSGTNQAHGALFNFFRNDALDATDWFANAQGLAKPALRQNDFGGVFGGPVILPRTYNGKDRTFFFVSYEGLRLRQPQVVLTDVPSLETRAKGSRFTRPFLDAFPLPNRPDGRLGFAGFAASYTDRSSLDATSVRGDHQIGSRATLFGRHNHAPSESTARLSALSNPTKTLAGTQTVTVGSTVIFSPRLVNESRFNYSRTTGESYSWLDDFGGARPPAAQAFFPSFAEPKNSFGGYFLLGGVGSNWYLGKNVANLQQQINAVDHVSFTRGAHQLKFGADYRRIATLNSPRGYDLFVYFVGTAGAHFGRTNQTTIGAQEDISVFFHNLSLYAQDTWKPARRLTVTYGLRWERNPAPQGSKQLYTFEGYAEPEQIRLAAPGAPLYGARNFNFAPRFGVAWQASDSITLRGGFGVFYDLGAGIIGQAASSFPYFRQKNLLDGSPFPVPEEIAQPAPFSLRPPVNVIYGAERGLNLPVTLQWNFGIERSFGGSNALSVAYVAAAGRRLLRQTYFVNPNEDFTYAHLLRNSAFSDFHSLQAQFQRRLSRGVQILASYTWAKSLDTNSADSISNLAARQIVPRNDRGPSDFDVRHTFSAAFSWDLPPQRNLLLRGWALDGVVTVRSATPVDVTFYRDLGFGLYNIRPDRVPGQSFYVTDPNVGGGRRFNADAFEVQREFPGRQGTLGRNALRGFGLQQTNLNIRREFRFLEHARLQFRAEMFNVWNHPSFADPNGSLLSPQFGYSTRMLGRSLGRGGVNGGLNPLYQIGGPRSIQLALRISF